MKKSSDFVVKRVFELSFIQQKLLRDVFVYNLAVSSDDNKYITNFVDDAREKNLWFQCTCRNPNPIIAIVKHDTGKLYLRHINLRGEHSLECEFKEYAIDPRKYKSLKSFSKNIPFHIHKNFAEYKKNNEDEVKEPGKSKSSYNSTLARVLYTLMNKVELNIISTKVKSINNQYMSLVDISNKFLMEKGIPLKKFFYTHPKNFSNAYSRLKLYKGLWPVNSRPYAVFFTVADSFNEKTVMCKIKGKVYEINLSGRLTVSSGRISNKKGPFACLFTYTSTSKHPDQLVPYNCFIVPVYSKSLLVPVDSSYERKVLEKLLSFLPWWEKKGLHITIKKPLFDITANGIPVKPDFILRSSGGDIVCEVMGSNEIEYRQRKAYIVPVMGKIGEVVEFDAFAADQYGSWNYDLSKFGRIISSKLFSLNKHL